MKKATILFSTLFFFCYAYTADMDTRDTRSEPNTQLSQFFLKDPEVAEWMKTHHLIQSFSPASNTQKILLRLFSAAKRSCEIVGCGVVALGLYAVHASDSFPETAALPILLPTNETCPIISGLY